MIQEMDQSLKQQQMQMQQQQQALASSTTSTTMTKVGQVCNFGIFDRKFLDVLILIFNDIQIKEWVWMIKYFFHRLQLL